MEPKQVTVGEQTYRLGKFKAIKGIVAGQLLARIARRYPQISDDLAAYNRKYREQNTIRVTREMARWERFSALGLVDSDFDNNGGYVEVPLDAGGASQILAVLPQAWDMAEHEVLMLLSLVTIPVEDLRGPYRESPEALDQALHDYGQKLLFEADLDELTDLLTVAAEILQEQFAGKGDKLGKMMRRVTNQQPQNSGESSDEAQQQQQTQDPSSQTGPVSMPEPVLGTVVSRPDQKQSDNSQTSSTDSQQATDGQASKPSSVQTGAS